ncbi:MAG: M56 family metallopeptidase [Akkermansiaceae bacterium]|nr:M56 family metallopeptidase [Akkermansiaceae bacterium]MDP4646281.1 M56 family metallopeptidase [Akkermansiaceae bacterium]MDP4721485.1 M56 family metallopeptidase [Akkermansiaceae bacterium]MDP4779878.1 M56 family metallopeptidase [Akkermansiaceae bacterium]MDP4845845.1 M56 family metallopeptidase [Akkermansiaceae bacterium]
MTKSPASGNSSTATKENETLTTEMIALATFSLIATGLVLLAGRKDAARDPRLTFSLLMLMAVLPLLGFFLPKIEVLPTTAAASTSTFPWAIVLTTIWASGLLICIARLAWAAIGLNRWRKRATEIESIDGVAVLELPELRGPVAAGIFRKVIFVPESWKTFPKDEQKMVLAHELAHHRRRDPLWRLCAELARAAHWYHPLAHWMAKRFSLQCEYACDESVIRQGSDAKRYATLLCDFAEKRANSPFALAMADSSSLEKRVGRMFQPTSRSGILTFAILGSFGAITACALAMLGNQQTHVPDAEIQLRMTANPFPGER